MFQIVSEVYGVVLRNWRLVFRFGGGPALALGLFMVLSPFLVDLPTAPAEGETVTVTASGALAGMVAILVMSGLSLWLVVAHAIRWHRFALYGEQPANPLRLEFGARGWRYLWASFIVSMLSLAAILPLMALGGGLMGAGAGGMALGLLSVMAASMYVLGRVGL
ncbi:MAG TPA: hypothetical protein VEH84_00195, partial [Alphaproteobacteria bacterium]|nr:hypothetical protein [Alphaproteobacteria bacterium]